MSNRIDIEINPNLKPFDQQELLACQTQLQTLEDNFSLSSLSNNSFGNVPSAMSTYVSSAKNNIVQQYKGLTSVLQNAALGESISSDIITGLKQGIAYLTANVESLFSSTGSVGKIFSSVPSALAKDFEHEFTDMSKTASSLLRKSTRNMGPQSDDALVSILKNNGPFAKGASAVSAKYGLSNSQIDELLKGVVQYTTPSHNRDTYYQKVIDASQGTLKRLSVLPEYVTYKDRLPEKFRNFPDVPKTTSFSNGAKRKAYQGGDLSDKDYAVVKAVASKYPAFEAALTMAGVAKRGVANGKAGQLIMPTKPISEAEYGAALGFLDRNIFRPALEGAPMYRHFLSNSDDYAQKAIARKTSRTASESFAAFDALQGIPVREPLYLDKPRSYRRSADNSSAVDSSINVRPDYFQIMSLTLDDLKNGVILDDKGPKQSLVETRPAGKSVNKMINRSIYTDLLGMAGHNTYGSESGPRRMLQLDLSDRIYEKDSAGRTIFENGRPKPNAETMAFVSQLFDVENGKTITTPGNHQLKYNTISYGKNGTYVPTGIHKNGVIDLALESAYLEKATQFVDKYGVDVFQNLISQDETFDTIKGLNKPIDARNRIHTPSIPLSELGGRMPDKNQIAFVDLHSLTGFDGGAMFMPGYLPADAMTLRSVGFKGAGFNTDFKKMIKDVYGDVDSFYAPTWNAPEEMKELYKKSGIEAVRQAYEKSGLKSFDEDFVDILKYEALIDKTMDKTTFYKGKTHSQIQEQFSDIADLIGGVYGVTTDKEFLSRSDSISRQVTQNLALSKKDVAANRKKWEKYIDTLEHNPEETIKLLFSDPDDPLAQRVSADHSLFFSDPEARARVNDSIQSAKDDLLNERFFAKGDAINALAINNPFELISAMAKANKKAPVNKNLAKVLSLKGRGDEDAVALAAWADGQIAGWRYPNNVGEQFKLYNSKDFIDLLDEYGISRNAMIMNMDTIKKMGGGDFDGDTVQAVRNRLRTIVERTWKFRGSEAAKLNPTIKEAEDIPLEGGARKVRGSDFADMLYRKAASVLDMAGVSNAGDALSQGDWLDPEWAKFARQAGVDLRAMYDIDTTFAKTGVLASWSHYARGAKNLGTPYVSMFKNLHAAIQNSDFSNVKDFSKVNFPSRYSNLTTSMLAAGMDSAFSNDMIESFIQAQEFLQGLDTLESSNNPADKAKAQYLRKNNSLMAQIASNRAQIVSTQDENELKGLYANWAGLVSDEYNRPGISQAQKEYWRNQLYETELQKKRLEFLHGYGITEEAAKRKDGFISSSGLAKGRLTGSRSNFASTFDAEQDALLSKSVVLTGADPQLLAASENIARQEAIAEAANKANTRQYSWSQLHTIEKSASGGENWYTRYVAGIPDEITPLMLLGSAYHKVQETWAGRRMKNQTDYGTPDEYEALLNDYLLNWVDEKTGKKLSLFPELPTEDSKLYEAKVKQRYQSIVNSVRGLPDFMKDLEIIGAEKNGGVVHPNLGVDKLGRRLDSVGYIDLVTRDPKTGAITNWDAKEGFTHDKSLEWIDEKTGQSHRYDQPVLYAGDNKATHAGIISYGNGKLETRSVPITPGMISSVEDRMRNLSTAAINLMENSDPFHEIRQGYFNKYALPGVFSFQSGRPLNPPELPFPNNGGGGSNNQPPVPPVYSFEGPVPVMQVDKPDLTKAFSGRHHIDETVDLYEELRGRMASMSRKYEQKTAKKPSTQWDNFRFQLGSDHYEDLRNTLSRVGASDEELALFSTSFDLARQQFEQTLRAGASGDFVAFNEDVFNRILNRKTTSSARKIVNEQKEIDENIERARSAYDILKGKTGKDATEEDKAALAKAETALNSAYELKEEYEQMLLEDAEEIMSEDISKFILSSQGKNANPKDKIKLSASKFEKQQDILRRSLDNLRANDKIGKDKYDELSTLLNSFSKEDYEKLLNENLQRQNDAFNITRQNQIDSISRQNDMVLEQQEQQYDRYKQQRRMRRSRSRFMQLYNQDENYRISLENQAQAYSNKIADERGNINLWRSQLTGNAEQDKGLNKNIAQAEEKIKGYTEALRAAEAEQKNFSSGQNAMNAAMTTVSNLASAAGRMLGRQLWYRIRKEVTSFVRDYDKSMTEIQMITLKSDEEISQLGDKLIRTAQSSGSTVTEVTSAASNLYRQGLTDEEVDARLDDVIKFSKVAGIKTTEASKIITTALQNGLVDNSQEAMDALVALGDSAATTASEISKGMQKSAAAAKQAGMSYGELVTLLTIGTSKTQLGGSNIGSSLNTLIYRLYKVNNNEDFTDEAGRHISSTAATKALSRMGISLYDDKGNFRGPYQILQDIGAGWENADDTTQSMILTTLGAGRQRSNIATLLQGLAEDNGELAQRYLNTAQNSEGITDRKYENYLDSLEAKLNNVKTAFDNLISSFELSGTATNFLDFLSETIQNITAAEKATGALSGAIKILGVALGAMMIAAKPWAAAFGVIALAATGIVNSIGAKNRERQNSLLEAEEERTIRKSQIKQISDRTSRVDQIIEETKSLIEKSNSVTGLTSDETAQLEANLGSLAGEFGHVGSEVQGLIGNYDDLIAKMKEFETENDKRKGRNTTNIIDTELNYGSNPFDASSNLEYAMSSGNLQYYLSHARYTSTGTGMMDYSSPEKFMENSVGEWMRETLRYIYDNNMINLPVDLDYIDSADKYADLIISGEGGTKEQRATAAKQLFDFIQTYKGEADKGLTTEIKSQLYEDALNTTANDVISKIVTASGIDEKYASLFTSAFVNRTISSENFMNDPFAAYQTALEDLKAYTDENGVITKEDLSNYVLDNLSEEQYIKLVESKVGKSVSEQAESVIQQQLEMATARQISEEDKDKLIEAEMENLRSVYTFPATEEGFGKGLDEYFIVTKATDHPAWVDSYYGPLYKVKDKNTNIEEVLTEPEFEEKEKAYREAAEETVDASSDWLLQIGDSISTFDHEPEADEIEKAKKEYEDAMHELSLNTAEGVKKIVSDLGVDLNIDDLVEEQNDNIIGPAISASKTALDNALSTEEMTTAGHQATIADTILKSIDRLGIKDMQGLLNAVDEGKINESVYSEALEATGIATLLSGYLEEIEYVNEEGKAAKKLVAKDEQNVAFGKFIGALASKSNIFKGLSVDAYADRAARAAAILKSINSMGSENAFAGDIEDLTTVYGDQFASKVMYSRMNISGDVLSSLEKQYAKDIATNYGYGVNGLLDFQKINTQQELFNSILNGTYSDYVGTTDQTIIDAYTSGNDQLASILKAQQQLNKYEGKNKPTSLTEYAENQEQYKEFTKVLEEAGIPTENFKTGIDNVDEALKKASADVKNFAKDTKSTTAYMDLFSKDAKKSSSAIMQMNQSMSKISQNQYYRQQYKQGKRDSETVNAVAGLLGVDKRQLESMNKALVDSLLESSEQVDISGIEDYANSLSESISQTLTDHFKNGDTIEVEGAPITIGSGPVSVSLDDALNEAGLYLNEAQERVLQELQAWGVKAHLEVNAGKDSFDAKLVIDGLGSGTRGGGGGGGGGKSAVDKLLEDQKHRLAEYEHRSKLLSSAQKEYDFNNDYERQASNFDEQIGLQYQFRNYYNDVIAELTKKMSSVAEKSDDWYKLRDAIYAAQEALAEINNTINELNSQKIQELFEEIEKKEKPTEHKQNMLEKYAQLAMSEDRFLDYVNFSEQSIEQLKARKDLNNDAIEREKEKLKELTKDDENWDTVADAIRAKEEENADLDVQIAQAESDLGSQRLSQIAKVLQQDTQTATHNQAIASMYGSFYETGGYRSQYEEMIKVQREASKSIAEDNKVAEAAARERLESLKDAVGTTEWFEAKAAVEQYQKAIAQAAVDQKEFDRALAESKLSGVIEKYQDATREISHVNDLLLSQAQEYLDTNDFEAYYSAMEMYIGNIPSLIKAEQDSIKSLWADYNKGMKEGTLDPEMQRQYLDQINTHEANIRKMTIDQAKQTREVSKVRLDKLFEDQEYEASEYEHNMRLLGYEMSRYQNNGELTNVNTLIKEENSIREDRVKVLQSEIKELQAEQKLFASGSKEEKRIVEQIKKREEAIASENTQIDKNNKLYDENVKKIMQIRKAIEDSVDKELEAEKKRNREILAANVSMQSTIVDLLRKRLQDEWNLKKKDIEKEKENLNEYKKLINERFAYRKKASDQADKEEELADYRRQLALIQADPTRSKDALDLQRKIEELEKEQSWAIAEDEVNAENERIDDQQEGLAKFIQYNEELLNDILGDANNFAEEMNDILSGSFEDSYNKIMEFMRSENEAFMNSLPDAQKQMVQSWEDTWKKAKDIVDTNYPDIVKYTATKDEYIEFMRGINPEYRAYQEAGDVNSMALLERKWSDDYDNYVSSTETGASFTPDSHTLGDVTSKLDELKDETFNVNIIGIKGSAIDPYGLSKDDSDSKDFSNGSELNLEDLNSLFKEKEPEPEPAPVETPTPKPQAPTPQKPSQQTYYFTTTDERGNPTSQGGSVTASSYAEAMEKANAAAEGMGRYVDVVYLKDDEKSPVKTSYTSEGASLPKTEPNESVDSTGSVWADGTRKKLKPKYYAEGGLVDFTGPTWVDGTPQRPESFLDAEDTSIMRNMLDAFKYISVKSATTSLSDLSLKGNTTVGDINITINAAEFKSDEDYDKVARKVGQAFAKEIEKQGLNLSGYAF